MKRPPTISKKRTGDYEIVTSHVLENYRTGDTVPTEQFLADSLGVTRYAAFRALTELSVNGVIRREKGRGSVVIGDYRKIEESKLIAPVKSQNVAYLAAEFESFMHVEILRGIDEFTRGADLQVSLLNSNYDPITELANIENVAKGSYCGCIAVLCNESDALRKIETMIGEGQHFVQVDRHSEHLSCPWVESDHEQGAYNAVKYLISLGHTKIAHLTSHSPVESVMYREQGYRRALDEAGIPIREEYIQRSQVLSSGQIIPPDLHSLIAYEPMHKLLTLPEPPTAVFLLNDCFAPGALQATLTHGLSVPNDMSLIGFDDGPEARLLSVPLTTVTQPFRQIGYKAAEMLNHMIQGTPLPEHGVTLPTRLTIRSSTRPPKSKFDGRSTGEQY